MNNHIAIVFNAPDMTARQYDQIIQELETQGLAHPDGRLYHVAAPTEEGWLVVDVWASEEHFDRFGEALMPIIVATGATPPQPKMYAVHNEVVGRGASVVAASH